MSTATRPCSRPLMLVAVCCSRKRQWTNTTSRCRRTLYGGRGSTGTSYTQTTSTRRCSNRPSSSASPPTPRASSVRRMCAASGWRSRPACSATMPKFASPTIRLWSSASHWECLSHARPRRVLPTVRQVPSRGWRTSVELTSALAQWDDIQ